MKTSMSVCLVTLSVSSLHWTVSLLILPLFFCNNRLKNLGLWEVDFGVLQSMRHLTWMCFRAFKIQEPKGSVSFFFCLVICPLEFADACSLPSVAQVNVCEAT